MARYQKFEPTEHQRGLVRVLVLSAQRLDIIAQLIINPQTGKPITRNTLARTFKDEIELSRAGAKANVLAALYNSAVRKGNVTAQIFLAKTWLGLREDNGDDWERRGEEQTRGPSRDGRDGRRYEDLSAAELAKLYREKVGED